MKQYGLRLGFSLVSATLAAVLSVSVPLAGAGRAGDPPTDRKAARPGTARPVAGGRVAPTAVDAHKTTIVGTAWNADNTPIKFASVRLRDVVAGAAIAVSKADESGQFAFENVPAGSYVVELLDDGGKVETIGHVFTIAPGESVATFVRLGTRGSWAAAFFSNTAAAVASTAATDGVTAFVQPRLCSSPPCH